MTPEHRKLSSVVKEVLTAVTLKRYDVPPEGLPAFAEEIAPLIAAALRAVANQVVPPDSLYARSCCEFTADNIRAALLTIADELEAQ
jgi:hypothetical protein